MIQKYVPPPLHFGDWDLNSYSGDHADTYYAEDLAAEALQIAGAQINVFRMLGVHEQGQLQDLTGAGNPLSSGTAGGYVLADAFTSSTAGWESLQVGPSVLSSFIGYNFGTLKTASGSEQYNPSQPIRQEITSINIQQGPNPQNRVLQARIERSDDGGVTWLRADVVNLPNTAELELISVKQSGPSQMWRIVPLMFAGGSSDGWIVVQVQMMNYTQTNLGNIEDLIFLENRDRDYANISIQLRGHYDLIDVETELTKFGIDLPQQYLFTVSYARMVTLLGRPVVIGDIIELPSEAQYDNNLIKVRKWLEVTDTTWSTEGYAPGWRPILYRITATPAIASQENMSLFKSDKGYTTLTDDQFMVSDSPLNQLVQEANEIIIKTAEEEVPLTGSDTTGLRSGMPLIWTDDHLRGKYDGRDYSVEDGLPPNNQAYTEGTSFPTSPSNEDYFRMNYTSDTYLPPKLYQWNQVKNRWIYLETDRRLQQSSYKPSMRRLIDSSQRINLADKL